MKQEKLCEYKDYLTGWKCHYKALDDSEDGFCIFHDTRKDKDITTFNNGIKRILENENSETYDFHGYVFPVIVDFSGFKFKKDVYFIDSKFVGNITLFREAEFTGKNTSFERAKFSGEIADFHKTKFLGENISFSMAEFSSRYTDFEKTEFASRNIEFGQSKFAGENTLFLDTIFSGERMDFSWAEFLGKETNFITVKFSSSNSNFIFTKFSGEHTFFSWVEFIGERTNFTGTEFIGKEVNFYHSNFLKKIVFTKATFKARTSFTGVDLGKCIFANVDLKNVDFSLLEWDWKDKLSNETKLKETLKELRVKKRECYFITSEIYQQLKVQFHNKRDFAKAGMFHFREQECKRKACKLPKDFFRWIFLWILKLSCGYGEKLRNVGLSSLALVLIFGIIYMFLGLHSSDLNESLIFQYVITLRNTVPIGTIIKDYLSSLSFSVKGFFPLWRFQQYKVVGDFANLVAGFEFLLGAFLIGLFIYVFRRRMEK
jgi:uncharacterized protein YjbI with pentapeptide repeats